jgi:transposase
MAHWLARSLGALVDELIVCDPRRNGLISQDGDSDDRIDAKKLAMLLRGGFLRAVYHSDNDAHVLLKQWVGLYHDRVKDAVRQINKIRALCWRHGVRPARGALRDALGRKKWLGSLGRHPAVCQLEMLFLGFDAAAQQVALSRERMVGLAKGYPIVKWWQELPGVGPIRAITLYAYLDTPWRFGGNPHKLWKYCGVGLERSSSGKDRQGRMRVGQLQLAWKVNRRLKAAVMGAAVSAVQQGKNVFAEQYERLVRDGLTTGNALHTVARKLLTVEWGMWKTGTRFDPKLV